jgi:lysophospholipase L1-like esterase
MGVGALDARRRAPPAWWLIDSGAWFILVLLGPDQGAILLVCWRLVGVLGTTGLWLHTNPRVAVLMLLMATMSVPVAVEAWMRTTSLNESWQMGRLSGERPNEKGWDSPVSGWTGRCGDEDAARTISVVVAGGSSVGGAYQFGGEPEAFFTAKAHEELCRELPAGVRLTTHNFGDGDRNTYTISRTIDAHLESADILVMYVGVNDVFTTQNTMTRKEREERASGIQSSSNWLPQWVRESRLAVGLSLWFRARPDLNAAQVADVPLSDAKENHRMIIDAARHQGDRVVLLTEHVSEAQRSRLYSYAQMQRAMRTEDVRWVDASRAFLDMVDKDSLVDSNHLSRAGNARLGEFLADQIEDWVYGSSR